MLGNRPNHSFDCACEMSASSAISATFNIPEHLAATASANFMSRLKLAEIHRACEKVSILLWDRDLLRYNDTRGDAYDCTWLIWKSNNE